MIRLACAGLILFMSISSAAAQSYPRCDALGEAADRAEMVSSPYLDAGGYPIQGSIPVEEIVVATTEPCLTTYAFLVDGETWVVPDARLTTTGTWKRLDRRRGISSEPEEMSVSQGASFSEGMSHEVSIGLSAASEIEVSPFGIGMNATFEVSAGYAFGISKERSKGIDRSISVTVNPGDVVEIWERVAKVNVEWTPEAYDYATLQDPLTLAQKWVTDVYLPTYTQRLVLAGQTQRLAEVLTLPEKLIYSAPNWPAEGPVDVLAATKALEPWNHFLTFGRNGFKSTYGLPYNETATVRYKF